MFKKFKQAMSVYDAENRYNLTKSRFFQNTTLLRDSGFKEATCETKKSFGVEEIFSGFVFRSEMGIAADIFQCGFHPLPLPAFVTLADASRGEPYWSGRGLETFLCFAAACWNHSPNKNEAYLIDARDFIGIPQAGSPGFNYLASYEILRECYTVKYTHPIPGNKIVGIARSPFESGRRETSFLFFYMNRGYVGRMGSARDVVECFNDDEWELV
ncbi:hypothetical protein [Endozoicomonas euniceicola]|uniref:RES domain-containing protein n=1 Tax=Endozoicomonas euniceicola TaxID=1234143 RepID=A0ABY6GWX7_9GAMM|nr:hypothetical protein [Endozoicomonas euniceicola]UYM17275.1 hypothetical protein NX720_04955 [Endozoicomonas euniceicola]